MAAELPVNGNYGNHMTLGASDYVPPHYSSTPSHLHSAHDPPPKAATPSNQEPHDVPKDQVGWYFVEQYYMTLSRTPERMYLFYHKSSQFVSGQEAEKVQVCVGQRAINDRIKELDFKDTKVRVTNVDSQASGDDNIVIQVIGEISNKQQPHRKFAQTFVLAKQANGYFVLNDVFRYLVDEDEVQEEAVADEVEQAAPAAQDSGYLEPAPTAVDAEQEDLTTAEDPEVVEHDASLIDQELEEKAVPEEPTPEVEEPEPAVNGDESKEEETVEAEDAPVAVAPAEVEQPQEAEPEPTRAASPPKQATPQPAPVPAKPAAPKTWASLAASANRVATPTAPPAAAPSAPAQRPTPPKASTPTSASAPNVPPTAPAAQRDSSPANASSDEWTAVTRDSGSHHQRQQSRAQPSEQQGPQSRGYIKNVYEGVDAGELRSALEQYGEIAYLDVSRQKNCAFVDFKTPEGYSAAVAANPHVVSGEHLFVEERHVRPRNGPFVPRGQFQGGDRRGRGGFNPGRGNFGGNGPRGGPRGGASQGAPRGKSGPTQG